ncbi:hypothetical protein HanPSC8_Chr17g0789171 [Helianthus annuus]|nr:hypothetical protein HanPSC8_Chr17g0789171 [Helianthus annuus]
MLFQTLNNVLAHSMMNFSNHYIPYSLIHSDDCYKKTRQLRLKFATYIRRSQN